jgi:sterol 14alpha-demethylase
MNQQLRMLKTGLAHEMLVSYCPKIEKEVRAFMEEWRATSSPNTDGIITLDIKEAMAELTVRTASRCLLGDEIRNELHHEFADYYEALNHGMTHFSVFFPRAPTKAHRERDQARRNIVSLFSKVIQRRRENRSDEPHHDLLQVFMDAEYTDGNSLSDDHVRNFVMCPK